MESSKLKNGNVVICLNAYEADKMQSALLNSWLLAMDKEHSLDQKNNPDSKLWAQIKSEYLVMLNQFEKTLKN